MNEQLILGPAKVIREELLSVTFQEIRDCFYSFLVGFSVNVDAVRVCGSEIKGQKCLQVVHNLPYFCQGHSYITSTGDKFVFNLGVLYIIRCHENPIIRS